MSQVRKLDSGLLIVETPEGPTKPTAICHFCRAETFDFFPWSGMRDGHHVPGVAWYQHRWTCRHETMTVCPNCNDLAKGCSVCGRQEAYT